MPSTASNPSPHKHANRGRSAKTHAVPKIQKTGSKGSSVKRTKTKPSTKAKHAVVFTKDDLEKIAFNPTHENPVTWEIGDISFTGDGTSYPFALIKTIKSGLRINVELSEIFETETHQYGLHNSRIISKGENQLPLWDHTKIALISDDEKVFPFWESDFDNLALNHIFCTGILRDESGEIELTANILVDKDLYKIVGISVSSSPMEPPRLMEMREYTGWTFTPHKVVTQRGKSLVIEGTQSLLLDFNTLRLDRVIVDQSKWTLRVSIFDKKTLLKENTAQLNQFFEITKQG